MDSNEVNAVVNSFNDRYKNSWEQTRYIAFIIAASNTSKIKTPTDLIKFSWEQSDEHEEHKTITKAERIAREQEMLKWLKSSENN